MMLERERLYRIIKSSKRLFSGVLARNTLVQVSDSLRFVEVIGSEFQLAGIQGFCTFAVSFRLIGAVGMSVISILRNIPK